MVIPQTDRFKLPIFYWLFVLFLSTGISWVDGVNQKYTAPIETVVVHNSRIEKPYVIRLHAINGKTVFSGHGKKIIARIKLLLSQSLSESVRVTEKLQCFVSQQVIYCFLRYLISSQTCLSASVLPNPIS